MIHILRFPIKLLGNFLRALTLECTGMRIETVVAVTVEFLVGSMSTLLVEC